MLCTQNITARPVRVAQRSPVHSTSVLKPRAIRGFAYRSATVGIGLNNAPSTRGNPISAQKIEDCQAEVSSIPREAVTSVGPAVAARSGGRVGGSAFGARSSMSSSFGGGSSFGGRSSGGSSIFGGSSLGGGSFSRSGLATRRSPSVSINSFGWYGPPGPFYGGGYAVGPVSGGGGGGFGTIVLLGILAAVLYTAFTGFSDSGDAAVGERVTVAKLQVGLLGSARQLQKDLDRIAGKANTNSPTGLHYILQETVLALLRNPDYCVYGAAATSKQRGLEAGESRFNELSMEERSKFKEETLVNVGGRTRSSTYRGNASSQAVNNELIVVTIIVAAEGGLKLPKVTSLEELRTALNRLGSIGAEQTLAVEVLWTPQDENDYYTKDEIFQDYPTLNNL